MLDILICIIPKINPDAPTVGPALLKSHLMDEGFTCEVVDLNISLFNALKKINKHEHYFFDNDTLFKTTNEDIENDSLKLNSEFQEFYKENESVFLEWIDLFKRKNPKWIGLSILSIFSQSVALKLSQLIRQYLPNTKIVWGGSQVSGGTRTFKEIGLLDYYIFGDGEQAIIELLKGNTTYNGINSSTPAQVLDLNSVKIPNYDDINWDEYHVMDFDRLVYITGSRGCVKRCTFCNVYQIWPEYRFRSGKHIAQEIIAIRKKYNRHFFKFTDSLINGSMKAFRELLHELKEYRKTDPDFKWSSQWIVRPKSQSPESDYQLMVESGCVDLEIGIESFSQHVRYHMGKKFTDEDMWWCFEMLQKYKIQHVLLMIVGYPTETEEDHQHTLNTIQRLYDNGYAHSTNSWGNKLLYLSFGNILMFDRHDPLWDLVKDVITSYTDMHNWDYKGNTLQVRTRRFNEINEFINKLNDTDYSGWIIEKELRLYNKLTGVNNADDQ
jgi:radical SAM superfamily enzyme YgiQ (UPF0313 family)